LSRPPLLLDDVLLPLPLAAAPELPEQSSRLQLVLLLDDVLLPPAELEPDEVRPPLELDELLVVPSEPQPDDEAAPPMMLFSASASHSVSPPVAPAVLVAVGGAVLLLLVAVLLAWRGMMTTALLPSMGTAATAVESRTMGRT